MIAKSTVEKYKIWFDYYINQFLIKYPELSENIQIKADHCKKVSEEIVDIAKNLQLNENEILLAQTIGLFHDLGRFRQYVKYQTFSDSKSQNHAELAIDVLKENRILSDLSIENQEIIYNAIKNHSRAEIMTDKNDQVLFFSKLIRYADKLDIWRLITEYYMHKQARATTTLEHESPTHEDNRDEESQATL